MQLGRKCCRSEQADGGRIDQRSGSARYSPARSGEMLRAGAGEEFRARMAIIFRRESRGIVGLLERLIERLEVIVGGRDVGRQGQICPAARSVLLLNLAEEEPVAADRASRRSAETLALRFAES